MERFIGVLATQHHIEAAVRPAGKLRESSDSENDLRALAGELGKLHPTLLVLLADLEESSRIKPIFKQAKLPLISITSRQAKAYAGRAGQTQVTAELLARLGEEIRPKSLLRDNKENKEFNALLSRRLQIIEMLATEKNRLVAGGTLTDISPYVSQDVKKHIDWLSASLEDLDTHLQPFWLMQADEEKAT